MTTLSELINNYDFNHPLSIPKNWLQGRTIYGGLSTALALQFILKKLDSTHNLRLRSAQVAFIGAMSEHIEFKFEILKKSKSSQWYKVEGFSNGELGLSINFLFTQDRVSKINHDFTLLQNVRSPENYQRLQDPQAPASLSNFDLRPAGGSIPVSSAKKPEIIAWVRNLDDSNIDPYVSLITLADSLPPAAMTTFTEFAPVSSMNWNFDLLHPIEKSEWHLLRANSIFSENGYSYQQMQIWNSNGDLILQGTQTVAVFL